MLHSDKPERVGKAIVWLLAGMVLDDVEAIEAGKVDSGRTFEDPEATLRALHMAMFPDAYPEATGHE